MSSTELAPQVPQQAIEQQRIVDFQENQCQLNQNNNGTVLGT